MTIILNNDHDLNMALAAIKNYLLSRTDTISIRKDVKAALRGLSQLNDIINASNNMEEA